MIHAYSRTCLLLVGKHVEKTQLTCVFLSYIYMTWRLMHAGKLEKLVSKCTSWCFCKNAMKRMRFLCASWICASFAFCKHFDATCRWIKPLVQHAIYRKAACCGKMHQEFSHVAMSRCCACLWWDKWEAIRKCVKKNKKKSESLDILCDRHILRRVYDLYQSCAKSFERSQTKPFLLVKVL